MQINIFRFILIGLLFLVSFNGFAFNEEKATDDKFDPKEMILHHVKDAHSFHLWDWKGHPVSLALPIILWTDNGLTTFMSSAFHHDDTGHHIVEKNGAKFVKLHEKIYQLNPNETTVAFDEEHHPTNAVDVGICIGIIIHIHRCS